MNPSLDTQKLVECWEPTVKFEVSEATAVDGQHVLGRVRGNFFVPNGTSRNNRYYPKELWEKVVKDGNVRKKMGEKLMFGTIGHGQKIDDFTLLEGKMTHIVVNLGLEGEQGIGEALILDTPAGRILNTVLRAGSQLRVSSRANGSFKGEVNGIPCVDPDTYMLETFDFVIDPGFFQANPKLVESLEQMVSESIKSQQDENKQGEITMDVKLVENMAKETGTLKAELERATGELETVKNENVVLKDKAKHLEFEFDKVKGFKDLAESLKTEIAGYKALGTVEEVKALTERTEKFTKEVGKFSEIREVMVKQNKIIEEFKALGGSAKKLEAALDRAADIIEEYKKLGTPVEIKEVFSRTAKKVAEDKAVARKAKVAELSKELGISEEKIEKLYGHMNEAEIRDFCKDMVKSGQLQSTYAKTKAVTESVNVDPPSEALQSFASKDRSLRLMESLGGGD